MNDDGSTERRSLCVSSPCTGSFSEGEGRGDSSVWQNCVALWRGLLPQRTSRLQNTNANLSRQVWTYKEINRNQLTVSLWTTRLTPHTFSSVHGSWDLERRERGAAAGVGGCRESKCCAVCTQRDSVYTKALRSNNITLMRRDLAVLPQLLESNIQGH